MKQKLNAKDFILIGVLTALMWIICMIISTIMSVAGPVTNVFYPSVVAIPNGIVMMLLLAKVPKKGVFTICAAIQAIRVACADQLAAANQREELERYAKDKGYEVAAAVAADGISGVHTEGIMNFLMNETKRQGIGTILTRDASRISRDASSFMRFERKFKENGIRFEYLSKPDNEIPVTPMMEAFEAVYKKRRTKNGKRA